MPSKVRMQRINDRIQQDLSEMLVGGKISDPRLLGVSITGVKVDRELSYADIFVSAVEGQEREKEILAGFDSANGLIRHSLAESLQLRSFPRLRFRWDPTPEKADRIERILASIRKESPAKEGKA